MTKTEIDKKTGKYVLIPVSVLKKAGVDNRKPLEYYVHEEMLIIKNAVVIDETYVERDCSGCPIAEYECDGECELKKKQEEKS